MNVGIQSFQPSQYVFSTAKVTSKVCLRTEDASDGNLAHEGKKPWFPARAEIRFTKQKQMRRCIFASSLTVNGNHKHTSEKFLISLEVALLELTLAFICTGLTQTLVPLSYGGLWMTQLQFQIITAQIQRSEWVYCLKCLCWVFDSLQVTSRVFLPLETHQQSFPQSALEGGDDPAAVDGLLLGFSVMLPG